MSEPRITVMLDIGFFRVVAQRDGMAPAVMGVFEPEESMTLEDCRIEANRYAHSISNVLGVTVDEFPAYFARPQ